MHVSTSIRLSWSMYHTWITHGWDKLWTFHCLGVWWMRGWWTHNGRAEETLASYLQYREHEKDPSQLQKHWCPWSARDGRKARDQAWPHGLRNGRSGSISLQVGKWAKVYVKEVHQAGEIWAVRPNVIASLRLGNAPRIARYPFQGQAGPQADSDTILSDRCCRLWAK